MEKGKKKLQIGSLTLASNILLAPMAGYTDIGFRSIAKDYGAGLCYTEMVSVKALYYESEKTMNLLETAENETPKAVQVFGRTPKYFALACQNPLLDKFDLIDINFGCPVKKIFSNGDGSALLKDIPLAAAIVAETKKNAKGRPVTVKMRTGITGDEFAVEFALAMERAGADAITVHGRSREQQYGGVVNLQAIANVKNAVKIPVIGNGDVRDEKSYKAMLKSGVDGVMVGRGAIGRPYIFSELIHEEYDFDVKKVILRHIELLNRIYDSNKVADLMKKHLCSYAFGKTSSKDVKMAVNRTIDYQSLLDIIESNF